MIQESGGYEGSFAPIPPKVEPTILDLRTLCAGRWKLTAMPDFAIFENAIAWNAPSLIRSGVESSQSLTPLFASLQV
jgi:hypothetical protein